MLAQTELAHRVHNLHGQGHLRKKLPAAQHRGQLHQNAVGAHKMQALEQLSPKRSGRRRGQLLLNADAAQQQHRAHQQARVGHQGQRRAQDANQHAGHAWPGHFGQRTGQCVLRMGAHQVVAPHQLGEHYLRRRAGHGVHTAQAKSDQVHQRHGQTAQPPGQRNEQQERTHGQLAHDIDRKLAPSVQKHAARQREQHKRQQFQGREQAHLAGAGLQQYHRGQRQGQHGDLPAQPADQERQPEPAVTGNLKKGVGEKHKKRGNQSVARAAPRGVGDCRIAAHAVAAGQIFVPWAPAVGWWAVTV